MHIVAIGGRGFYGARDAALDRYILELAGKKRPRVCFVPTASGDAQANIRRVYRAVRRLGGIPSHLSLFAGPTEKYADYLCRHDVIFVGGGNTRNLLALWRLWGLDAAMRTAYRRGVVLSGVSAGAICWFQAGLTDSFPGKLAALRAMGWLRGSFCPHFDSEPARRPIFRKLIREGALPGGYATDDGVALHYVDGKLLRAVSARARAGAFELRRRAGKLEETALPIRRLGGKATSVSGS
jgi:dipeptidase E